MEVFQSSLICRPFAYLFFVLYRCYEESVLAILLRGFAAIFRGLWADSLLSRPFTRESAFVRAWKRSLFCRALALLLNTPILLLQKLYSLLRAPMDDSLAARFAFGLTANVPIAVGWLMLVILVIPYKAWNNAYSLLGFALMLFLTFVWGMQKKRHRIDLTAIGPYAVFFALFVFLAVPLSNYPKLSTRFLLYHASCILCVLVIVSTVRRAYQLRRLAAMSSLGLIVISGYAFIQRIEGVEVNPSYVDLTLNKDMPGRVYSMFENPNAFGEVLVLLIPIAIALLFSSKGWGGRLLGLLGAGMGTVALMMTYSRAGWLGLASAAVLFVFLWKKKILPAVILLGLAAIPFLPDTIFNRILTIFNFSDTSTSSRFPLYEAALRMLKESPIQGAGLGIDAVRQTVSDMNAYNGKSPFVHCHNIYLQTWAETGFFGLLSLLATVGWAIKRGAMTVSRRLGGSSTRFLIIGSVSALLGIMVCGMADFIWHYPRVMLIFWFVFALAAASMRVAMLEDRQAQHHEKRSFPT